MRSQRMKSKVDWKLKKDTFESNERQMCKNVTIEVIMTTP